MRMGILATALASGVTAITLSLAAAAQAHEGAPEAPPPPEHWTEAFEFRAFVDGYAAVNYNFPKPAGTAGRPTRAFDQGTGFNMSWAGLDAVLPADPVGGRLQLRWGPTAELLAGPNEPDTLRQVKNAYATWRPGGGNWTFDLGKMDSTYGAETAESQDNLNYTRGALFHTLQFRHNTGVRATWQPSESFLLRGIVVNGLERTVDNNAGKSYGLQFDWRASERLGFVLGWIGGPEQDDHLEVSCPADTRYDPVAEGCQEAPGTVSGTYLVDRGGANELDAWQHLVDAMIFYDPSERVSVVLNGSLRQSALRYDTLTSDTEITTAYGGALMARYQFDGGWALAGRGEYLTSSGDTLNDPAAYPLGVEDLALATGTLTLEYKPSENLALRLENRGDFVVGAKNDEEKPIFQKELRDSSERMLTTTLGVVVTTN